MAIKKATKKTTKKTVKKTVKKKAVKKVVKKKAVKVSKKKTTKKKVTKKTGRPKVDFNEAWLPLIEEYALKGLNNSEISKKLKVGYSTFKNFKAGEYKKQITTAIKKGRDDFHLQNVPKVENALIKRALGYSLKEVKIEETFIEIKLKDGKTVLLTEDRVDLTSILNGTDIDINDVENAKHVKRTETSKHIPADPSSMFFYLGNRSMDPGNIKKWQSINKVIVDSGTDKKGILMAINKMLE